MLILRAPLRKRCLQRKEKITKHGCTLHRRLLSAQDLQLLLNRCSAAQELQEARAPARKPRAGRGTELTAMEREAESDALKGKGNRAFKAGDFLASHELYSAALQLASGAQKPVRSLINL